MTLKRKTIISTKVLDLLKKSNTPLSITQILDFLGKINIKPNKTTIYRLIDKLIETKIVTTITFSDSKTYFELTNKGHHHHFYCDSCNHIYCLDSCHVDKLNINLNELLPSQLFKISRHDFNLYGVCEKCINKIG